MTRAASHRSPSDSGFAPSKFATPPLLAHHVPRPHLCARLDADPGALTLVVGSPGAGKTTLLAEWHARQAPGTAVWVNVDAGDRDPVRLWRAVIAGVQASAPTFAASTLDHLRLDRRVDHEVLESLLVATDALTEQLTIVLDDLHLAGPEAHEQLGFLLGRGLGRLRVVVGSRSEPRIGLSRLRARGGVLEVRDADLRFAPGDAHRLLRGLGADLDDDGLQRVVERTEGWVAGLQLAALALAEADDRDDAVARLSGTNRVISHYLWSEVFDSQRPDVQRFLLDTCIVDELSPSLARALSPGNPVSLLDAEAANLLVRRLADDGSAFRFHHLLTDLLRFRLRADDPERETDLHRRATRWFAAHGDHAAACLHAWRSGDAPLALEAMHGTSLEVSYESVPLVDLELSLTDADIAASPGPTVSLAVALLSTHPSRAGRLAARVDALLADRLDDETRQHVLAVRSIAALVLGDTTAGARFAAEARLDLPDDTWPVMTLLIAAKCDVWEGRLDDATARARDLLSLCDTPLQRMEVLGTLAHAHVVAGELSAASKVSAQLAEEVADDGTGAYTDGVLGECLLAVVDLERGHAAAAEAPLREVAAVTSRVRVPATVIAKVGLSRLWAHDGRLDAARSVLASAYESIEAQPDRSGIVDHVRAQDARLALGAGDVARAEALVAAMAPSPDRLLLEAELARVDGRLVDAGRALGRVDEAGTTPRRAVEVGLARLRVALTAGDDGATLAAEVLDAAADDGFVLLLAEAGHEVLAALRAEARRRPRRDHTEQVLRLRPAATAGAAADRAGVATLTERERVILRYMATSMSYREIAEELIVSVNTVKTHARHINQKLAVVTRDEAVRRASELHHL